MCQVVIARLLSTNSALYRPTATHHQEHHDEEWIIKGAFYWTHTMSTHDTAWTIKARARSHAELASFATALLLDADWRTRLLWRFLKERILEEESSHFFIIHTANFMRNHLEMYWWREEQKPSKLRESEWDVKLEAVEWKVLRRNRRTLCSDWPTES